jgi:TolB protein
MTALRERACLVGILALLLGADGVESELPAPEADLFQQDVAWSPDGSRIAYSQYSGGADYDATKWAIHVADTDGADARLLVENAINVSWSPRGDRLVFSSRRDGNWELYAIGSDGAGLERLTDHPAADRAPAWSPTDRWIAFSSDRDGNREIYAMAADGTEVRRLTEQPRSDYNPAWSPDGRTIVFYREIADGVDQIYTVTLDGVETAVTRDTSLNTFPSFLPDGGIGFSCKPEEGVARLVRLNPHGEQRTELGPPGIFFARWSPDGRRIAFIAGRWPKSAIYTMGADGSNVEKVVN